MTRSNKSLVLFLGAGASQTFGFKGTRELSENFWEFLCSPELEGFWKSLGVREELLKHLRDMHLPKLKLLFRKISGSGEWLTLDDLIYMFWKTLPKHISALYASKKHGTAIYQLYKKILKEDYIPLLQFLDHIIFPSEYWHDEDPECFFRALPYKLNRFAETMRDLIHSYLVKELTYVEDEEKLKKVYSVLLQHFKTLDVFTTNYDLCVETFCQLTGKTLLDGYVTGGFFKDKNAKVIFDEKEFKKKGIRLYKLYGSINWAFDGTFLKLRAPKKFGRTNRIRVLLGPFVHEMYEPFTTALPEWEAKEKLIYKTLENKLKEKLEMTDKCLVIGYSFGGSFRGDPTSKIFEDVRKKRKIKEGAFLPKIYVLDPTPDEGRIKKLLGDENIKFKMQPLSTKSLSEICVEIKHDP